MSFRAPLLLLAWAVLNAGEAPAPPKPTAPAPAPAALDAATARRAEAAADAYLGPAVKPDPAAELLLQQVEVLLLEARSYLDAKLALKAGDCYLEAAKKLAEIPAEQRAPLGPRFRKASASLLEVSRILLADPAFNLGKPASEPH
jgi:hypothetical protein